VVCRNIAALHEPLPEQDSMGLSMPIPIANCELLPMVMIEQRLGRAHL